MREAAWLVHAGTRRGTGSTSATGTGTALAALETADTTTGAALLAAECCLRGHRSCVHERPERVALSSSCAQAPLQVSRAARPASLHRKASCCYQQVTACSICCLRRVAAAGIGTTETTGTGTVRGSEHETLSGCASCSALHVYLLALAASALCKPQSASSRLASAANQAFARRQRASRRGSASAAGAWASGLQTASQTLPGTAHPPKAAGIWAL